MRSRSACRIEVMRRAQCYVSHVITNSNNYLHSASKMTSLLLKGTHRFSFSSLQRWSSAAAVPLSKPIETSTPAQGSSRTPEDVKVSKVNGFTVASLENYSFLSGISVFMRAGSRYETYDQQGLTHLLRNCAFLGNNDRSAFRIARECDVIGASLNATSTREHIIYSSNFLRGNMVQVIETLGSVISRPQFKQWEVNDRRSSLSEDLIQAEASPTSVVLEGLHQVAYRNALCNPLYCPARNISKFTNEDLQSYVKEYFNSEGTVIVGVGVGHDELVESVRKSFSSESVRVPPMAKQAIYNGGQELRIPSNIGLTYSAIVCKGVSIKDSQTDLLAAGVLQHILGAEPQGYIKWGSNTSSARLVKAGALVTDAPFSTTALNLNYSDSGLFGMYIVSQPGDTEKLLRATTNEFAEVTKGTFSDSDLSRAKNQLKTRYLMSTEMQITLLEDIGSQVSTSGSYSPVDETLKLVDGVTRDDVIRFARAVFSTKASYVSHGNLSSAPYLDQLLTEVSLK